MWLVLSAALLGAVAGLLAVLPAYRLSTAADVPVRTGCHHCGRRLRPGLLGWFSTRCPGWFSTRCPGCCQRLGPSPLLLAGAGTVTFALLAGTLGADPALPAFLAVAGLGLVLCPIDLACLRLPDRLVGAAALLAGIGLAGAALALDAPHRLRGVLAGAVISGAVYLLVALLPGSRLGFGDVKLVVVLGLLLGWLGWRAVLLGLVLPHLLNGAIVLLLLATGRVNRGSLIPLGPALLVGSLLAVLLR